MKNQSVEGHVQYDIIYIKVIPQKTKTLLVSSQTTSQNNFKVLKYSWVH